MRALHLQLHQLLDGPFSVRRLWMDRAAVFEILTQPAVSVLAPEGVYILFQHGVTIGTVAAFRSYQLPPTLWMGSVAPCPGELVGLKNKQ